LATAGFGVIDLSADRRSMKMVGSGDFSSPAGQPLAERLLALANWLQGILAQYHPDIVAVEEMFFALNARTAVQMAHGRGALLLTVAQAGLPVCEYSALSIKQSVTGYGRATKEQVASMVVRALQLEQPPSSDHATDALAMALCHASSIRHPTVARAVAARAAAMGDNTRKRGKAAWRAWTPPESKVKKR